MNTLSTSTRVWLAAAENDRIPGGKVGGVGDVIRDLPEALSEQGCQVRVITPAFGLFHRLEGVTFHRELEFRFGGEDTRADIYRLPDEVEGMEQYVIDHPGLAPGAPGQVYHQDAADEPFATDAGKFALFCAALAAWVETAAAPPDILHLHDWHTGLLPVLRNASDGRLRDTRLVFTIHNLAYQGVRPLVGETSSLESWFPDLDLDMEMLGDPQYPDCVNFMATAIRGADRINTVSEGYAQEILKPSDPKAGFGGGEGLETLLQAAAEEGRLLGILNGCTYPEKMPPRPTWAELLGLIGEETVLLESGGFTRSRLTAWTRQRPATLLVSIGRMVDQKAQLFLEPVEGFPTALDAILSGLGRTDRMIMLGSGDPELEEAFRQIAGRHDNFLYLCGYAAHLSDPLYSRGDLFLMPSSFEPCGISQMLAMRAGQPCVVHGVGGLKDTVQNEISGLVFHGDTPAEQAEAFVESTRKALSMAAERSSEWRYICASAAAQRFDWADSARRYIQELYADG